MSIPEVAHRSWRLARHPIDLLRMRAGSYARVPRAVEAELARWRGPNPFYFTPELAGMPVGAALREDADAIFAGRRQILGLGRMALPEVPWHLEPKAGITWPMIEAARVVSKAPNHLDPRLTWEFNRGHEWVVLARVFAATGETRFLDRLAAELASWRTSNPIGIGINWVSAMEAAIRIHSFSWIAGFLRPDQGDLLRAIGMMIYEHAVFVANHLSYFSSANNHLIVELSGLIIAGRVLGGVRRLAVLRRRACVRLDVELARQIFADGVNAEMATHYHAFVLEALLLVAHLERAHGQPRIELEGVITKMADYLAALSCADGSLLGQGDSDDGKILPLFATDHAAQLIAAAATRMKSGSNAAAPPSGGEGVFWLTNGATPTRPVSRVTSSRRFEQSGQIVLRSDRLIASFNAGPFGFGSLAAHAHCDTLAINVALDGRRFLVDRGTYRYHGDRADRDRFRMTAAHNTVQVGTREQAEAVGPFLWSRRPTVTIERCELGAEGDLVIASHDGFAPSQHRRTLVHRAGILLVIDEVTGGPVPVGIMARFHFAPELSPVMDSARTLVSATLRPSGMPAGWLWLARCDQASIVTSLHSDCYCAAGDARTLQCDLAAPGGPALLTVLGPATVTESRHAIGQLVRFAEERKASPDLRPLRQVAEGSLGSG